MTKNGLLMPVGKNFEISRGNTVNIGVLESVKKYGFFEKPLLTFLKIFISPACKLLP